MTSLIVISNPLLNLRRVNIVPENNQTNLTNGNSVQIKFSHSSKLESPFFASTAVRRNSGQTQTHAHRSPIRSVKLSSDMAANEDRIAKISSTIRVIPDFPKPGNNIMMCMENVCICVYMYIAIRWFEIIMYLLI